MALNPTTRLEAINAMLATIGESPVPAIDSSVPDQAMAEAALDSALREVCSKRWRFNTEYGYTLLPAGVQSSLNVYEAPTDLAGFDLTRTPAQDGMDVIVRPSRTWGGGGTLIFYDRLNAAEGFTLNELKIDPVWLIDFELCPQSVRSYATTMAARRFQGQTKASEILHQITAEDEKAALAVLEEDQRMPAPVIPDGVPQTELGVVNLMLTATGQEPLASIDAPVGHSASQAINVLRSATKAVTSQRWRFNSEFNYTLAPVTTYVSGATYNVFEAPSNLADFRLSITEAQQDLEATIRPPREASLSAYELIIADRRNARDGFDSTEVSELKIDPIWLRSFDELPETARKYITVYALRRYLARSGGQEVAGFAAADEEACLATLREEQKAQVPVILGSTPQNETDAAYLMLVAAGKEEAITQDDALGRLGAQALNVLRSVTKEVTSLRWTFNSEHGYTLFPDRVESSLNVFVAPSGLADFRLSQTSAQSGRDALLRPSRIAPGDQIIADRLAPNVDGWDLGTLQIDPVWRRSFSECPEYARRYIAIVATRRFLGRLGQQQEIAGYSTEDERLALLSMHEAERKHSPQATDGSVDTELDALNTMLTAAGFNPVSSTASLLTPEATKALNVLRRSTKHILSERWRFNSERRYAISPASTATGGNVFLPPANLASFRPTRTAEQAGLDLVIRPSREYSPGTQIIADRLGGTDGVNVDTLYIDPVWLRAFDEIPEAARRYISVYATRRFLQSRSESAGTEVPGYTADDEKMALLSLHQSEIQVAPVSADGSTMSEVEAVNQMLSAVGHDPVVSVDTILTPEASEATTLLRQAVREVCAEGWKFNTEHGYEVEPTTTYEWTNSFNETIELDVFPVPAGLLSFSITKASFQQGAQYLDLAIREARESGVSGLIFVDRSTNRDGLLNRDAIYIDPVWLFTFDELPEDAKQYALVLASRRFAGTRSRYGDRDEFRALRALQRKHGHRDDHNIFDNASVRKIRGGRPWGPSGAFDHRATGG